jgi:hypothetical protein
MYNVAFFTESDLDGKITDRNFPNARTDVAWIIALQAYHIGLVNSTSKINMLKKQGVSFDIGIIILPKNQEVLTHSIISNNIVDNAKQICKKVAIMQEGPNWYFQDYNISLQQIYYSALLRADFILCHNTTDVGYYRGITGKNVYTMRPVMIEDTIKNISNEVSDNVIIGGNFVSWYGGFDSMIVAKEFNLKIFAPSMGRKQKNEEYIKGLNLLPYLNWAHWINTLSNFKYAVHLMRTFAAGSFALNCAYWGIPCIGYKDLDTQVILHHPILSVELSDVFSARKAASALQNSPSLYEHSSELAKENYNTFYKEEVFIKNMNEVFDNELSTRQEL